MPQPPAVEALIGFIIDPFAMDPASGEPARVHAQIGLPRETTSPDGHLAWAPPHVVHVAMRGTPGLRALGLFHIGDAIILAGHWTSGGVFHAQRVGPDTACSSFRSLLDRHVTPHHSHGRTLYQITPPPSAPVSSAPTL